MAEYSWTLLNAGRFRLDGGSMFGVVPKSIWSTITPPDESNRIPLRCNCVLVDAGRFRCLIETGYGEKWSPKERGFYDLEERSVRTALDEIGVNPKSIDLVVVTHLHFDHAGGLTHWDDDGVPVSTFPNAEIVVQDLEWRDACANKSTMTRTYLPSHLEPIEAQVRRVVGETHVAPGITVVPMPGHTWGQQAVLFRDDKSVVCFPGDVIPTIAHAAPAFNMGYDMEPYTNMRSKEMLLERAAAENWRLILDHEPVQPIVRVEPDPKRSGRLQLVPAG